MQNKSNVRNPTPKGGTSETCPECGHIHDKLGGNKKFQCPKCGYKADRDWNGTRNIMIRALSATSIR
ncbi:MAG: zinc ribbon domain-containing protein [Nostocaceae cyanobacterium]|nr:zinc ribbon domain-containing protein [Nostocaceae cyanobacterium]